MWKAQSARRHGAHGQGEKAGMTAFLYAIATLFMVAPGAATVDHVWTAPPGDLGPTLASSTASDGIVASFDCAAAETSAEELVCSDPALAALDLRLAERFSAAIEAAEALDAGAEEAASTLRAFQRGWIGGTG